LEISKLKSDIESGTIESGTKYVMKL